MRPDPDIFLYQVSSNTAVATSECPGGAGEFCSNESQYCLQETLAIDDTTDLS